MIRGVILAASLALCLGGIGMVSQGVAVPVKAEIGQRELVKVFEQRLAANGKTPRAREASRADGLSARPRALRQKAAELPIDGPIARISIERLGVQEIVLAGEATHEQLALGPAMLKRGDAANPVTVLAAHRDTHFRFIRGLREGDEIALQTVSGEVAHYRVTRLETVRWDRFAYPRDPAYPLLALTTCYPFGGTEYGGPWRRVAWAEQVDRGANPMTHGGPSLPFR